MGVSRLCGCRPGRAWCLVVPFPAWAVSLSVTKHRNGTREHMTKTLMLAAVAAVVLAGCGGSSNPEPVEPDAGVQLEAWVFWESIEDEGITDAMCDLGPDAFATVSVGDEIGVDPAAIDEYVARGVVVCGW